MASSIQRYHVFTNFLQLARLTGHAIQDAILFVSLPLRRYKARQKLMNLPMSVKEDIGLTMQKIDQFIKEMK